MKTLKLYSTLGCHLCEHAKAIIAPLAEKQNYELLEIDIADFDELIEKYAVTIPVLENVETGDTINWPFDEEAVKDML